jgi:hypothetical protein
MPHWPADDFWEEVRFDKEGNVQSTTIRTAIGAASTVLNALAGNALEYFSRPSVLTIYGNADIAGMNMALTFNEGGDSQVPIPPGSSIGLASTPGKIKVNEDFLIQVPVPAGARLVLGVTNPGAASNFTFQLVTG